LQYCRKTRAVRRISFTVSGEYCWGFRSCAIPVAFAVRAYVEPAARTRAMMTSSAESGSETLLGCRPPAVDIRVSPPLLTEEGVSGAWAGPLAAGSGGNVPEATRRTKRAEGKSAAPATLLATPDAGFWRPSPTINLGICAGEGAAVAPGGAASLLSD